MFDSTLFNIVIDNAYMIDYIGDTFTGGDIITYTPEMKLCDICLNEETNLWVAFDLCNDNSGILLFAQDKDLKVSRKVVSRGITC